MTKVIQVLCFYFAKILCDKFFGSYSWDTIYILCLFFLYVYFFICWCYAFWPPITASSQSKNLAKTLLWGKTRKNQQNAVCSQKATNKCSKHFMINFAPIYKSYSIQISILILTSTVNKVLTKFDVHIRLSPNTMRSCGPSISTCEAKYKLNTCTVGPRLSSHQLFRYLFLSDCHCGVYTVFFSFFYSSPLKICSKQKQSGQISLNDKKFVMNTVAMLRCIHHTEYAVFKHNSHVRPNCLSGLVAVPTWLDNRGWTVFNFFFFLFFS